MNGTKCKKYISFFLVAVMLAAATPLAGFIGLKISANAESFSEESSTHFSEEASSAFTENSSSEEESYSSPRPSSPSESEDILASYTNPSEWSSEEPTTEYEPNWSFDETTGTLTITITGAMEDNADHLFNTCEWLVFADSIRCVVFADGLTSIAESAFRDCNSLTEITIPDSVTSIGNCAFYGCSSLSTVTFGENSRLTSIGGSAFRNCYALTEITIPDSVTSIDSSAFYGCANLTTVTFGENSKLEAIGANSFTDTSLENINLPASVETINEYAFAGCCSLSQITADKENKFFCAVDGVLYNKEMTTLLCHPAGKQTASFVIPQTVTGLADCAFDGCSSLESITLPDNLTGIGFFAFRGCTALTNVYVKDLAAWCAIDFAYIYSNPITYAGNFYVNNSLISDFVIPDTVSEIKDYAFFNFDFMTSVVIPDSVTKIGERSFAWCHALQEIAIPAQVEVIEWDAFRNCKSLRSVTLPAGLRQIGYHAFKNCISLTSITLPDSISELCSLAFNNCTSLQEIDLPDNITEISQSLFSGCSALVSVAIPQSVTKIEANAFSGCEGLANIFFAGEEADWYASIMIAEGNETLLQAQIHCTDSPENPCVHSWGERTLTTPPTCTEDGFCSWFCEKCNAEHRVVVPSTGHSWIRHQKQPQEQPQDGPQRPVPYDGYICENCGITTQRPPTHVSTDGGIDPHESCLWNRGERIADQNNPTAVTILYSCLVCDETKTEENQSSSFVDNPAFAIADGNNIRAFAGVSQEQYLAQSPAGSSLLDKDGQPLAKEARVGTGCMLQFPDGSLHTIIVMGDPDGDGTVLSGDARVTLRMAVLLETLNEAQITAADVDRNGKVSAADARLILRASIGLESTETWLQ